MAATNDVFENGDFRNENELNYSCESMSLIDKQKPLSHLQERFLYTQREGENLLLLNQFYPLIGYLKYGGLSPAILRIYLRSLADIMPICTISGRLYVRSLLSEASAHRTGSDKIFFTTMIFSSSLNIEPLQRIQ